MRSVDKTLVMELALDFDRSNPKHQAAINYLSQPDVYKKFATLVIPEGAQIVSCAAIPEVPVTKGENQFKTWIGFLDLVLKLKISVLVQHEKREGLGWVALSTQMKNGGTSATRTRERGKKLSHWMNGSGRRAVCGERCICTEVASL